MNSFFFSFVGVNATDDAELVDLLVKCALRASTDGIDDLIPPHNPLSIRDVNISQTVLGVE